MLSGKPTDHRITLTATARNTPSWLLFLGLVPYLVARLTSRKAHGSLPLTVEVEELLASRRIRLRIIVVPCAVVALAGLLLLLFVLPGPGIILLIAPFSFLATISVLNRLRSPLSPVHLDAEGRYVLIPNAAEEYANALDGPLEASPFDPPPEPG